MAGRGRRAAGLAALVAVFAAGCGGANTVSEPKLSGLVLGERDVGKPFSSFYTGRQVRLDNLGTRPADPGRNGRKGGWIARYHRTGSRATRGPLVIESRADLFGDASGAEADLAAYRADFAKIPATQVRRLSLPELGDAAVGVTYVQAGALPVRFFRIAWRDRNVSASVTAEGFDGKIAAADAIELARRQERLIAAA